MSLFSRTFGKLLACAFRLNFIELFETLTFRGMSYTGKQADCVAVGSGVCGAEGGGGCAGGGE